MAKPSITKRTTKGTALTYSELDTNFQNLADATVSLTADTGGTQVTADLNGNITLVAGTGVSITGNDTAKTVTITSTANLTPAGSNQQIQYNNNGALGASSGLTYDGTSIKVNGNLESVYSNGDEGGEIFLKKAAINTTIINGVTIDVFQNKLRIFENGGTNRGGYYDITGLAAGASTNLNSLATNSITVGVADSSLVNFTAAGSAGSTKGVQLTSRNAIGATGIIRLGADNTDSFFSAGGNGSLNLNASGGGRINLQAPTVFQSYTTTERNGITATNGMMIYNSTTNKFQGYANGTWVDLH